MVEIEEDVTGLDQDINFMFEQTVIQDERIFNFEQTSIGILGDLDLVEDDIESLFLVVLSFFLVI